MHLKVSLSHFSSFHPQQQLPELRQTQMQLYKLAATCHPTGVKHQDVPSNTTMVTHMQVCWLTVSSDRNAGDISFRRRKMNASTCNIIQPCSNRMPFREEQLSVWNLRWPDIRVQPCHRGLTWPYYSAFLGFSFPFLLMTTNALLSHGNTASIIYHSTLLGCWEDGYLKIYTDQLFARYKNCF